MILVFGYENKKKYPICVSRKCCKEIYIDLLLIVKGGKEYYVLINNFNRSIYVHSLHPGRKHFSRYFLHDFITEEILERHLNIALKLMLNKPLKCLGKLNILYSKTLKEK